MTTPDFEGDPELLPYLTLDDRPGPAPRLPRERAMAMVETALAELPQPMAAGRRFGGVSRPMLAAAAIVLGVAGGAAAARWYFTERAPGAPETSAPAARAAQPKAAPEPEPAPAPASLPVEVEILDSHDPPSERARERSAPEDLLQKANRLRTLGKFREAAQTYSAVSDRYPKTLSAYVSQVAAASIELEHLSNPTRARRLFERALREHPEGALDLEARQGLATALRDLGQESAEADVLRQLIDMHEGSPAARRAAVRLKELGVE